MTSQAPKEQTEKLIKLYDKQVSLKWTLLRGILYGFGFFIGSGLLIGFLVYILSLVDTVPILGDFTAQIVEFVQEQQGLK